MPTHHSVRRLSRPLRWLSFALAIALLAGLLPPVRSVQAGTQSLETLEGGTGTITVAAMEEFPILLFYIDSLPRYGTLRLNGWDVAVGDTITLVDIGKGLLTYTHNGGETTADSFVYAIDVARLFTRTFSISITPVNDIPSFTKGQDITVAEDSGLKTVDGWASNISAGLGEINQSVEFKIVTNSNPGLFSVPPAINASGRLSFTAAPNAYGQARIEVQLTDNAGTAHGGKDTSAIQNTLITISPVNDAPSFTKGADITVPEDSGLKTVDGWASEISAGPGEAGQSVVFEIVTNSNPTLFSGVPTVSSSGSLGFTPAPNAYGQATIGLHIRDSGGSAAGGVDLSPVQNLLISVTPVNDPPSFSPGPTIVSPKDQPYSQPWASAISAGPNESSQTVGFTVVSNSNAALFQQAPALTPAGRLSFTPAADTIGSATIVIQLTDNGDGQNTSAQQSLTITIVPVNTPPSFTAGPSISVAEDSQPYSALWATNVSAGPPSESSQTLSFAIIANDNPGLFSAGPALSPNGTLSFTPARDASGSARLTVLLRDSGGVDQYGGKDTSTEQSFTISVTPINDAPEVDLNGAAFGGSTGATGSVEGEIRLTDPAITRVSDTDSAALITMTIALTNRPDGMAEWLSVSPAAGLIASYNPVAGLLSLTAQAVVPPTAFQSTLATLAYRNTAVVPDPASRLIVVRTSDGLLVSAPVTITLVPVVRPLLTLPEAPSAYVENSAPVLLDSSALITDTNTGSYAGGVLTVTPHNANAEDLLAVRSAPELGVSVSGSGLFYQGLRVGTISGGSGSTPLIVLFDGPIVPTAAVRATLRALVFSAAGDSPTGGEREIALEVKNGLAAVPPSRPKTKIVRVVPVNDPPTVAFPPTQAVPVDSASPIVGISLADPDAGLGTLRLVVDAAVGSVMLGNTAGLSCTSDVDSGAVSCTGLLERLNAALASLSYQGALNVVGDDTITVDVSDQGNSGLDGAKSGRGVLTVRVRPRPTVELPGADPLFTENGPAVRIDSTALITTTSGSSVSGSLLTVALISGGAPGDELFIEHQGFTSGRIGVAGGLVYYSGALVGVTQGGKDGVPLTISFNQPTVGLAALRAALRAVAFRHPSDDPAADPARAARVVQVVFSDGIGPVSLPRARQIDVIALNDPPTITIPITQVVQMATDLPVRGVSLTDPDARTGALRLTLAAVSGRLTLPGDGLSCWRDVDSDALICDGSLDRLNMALGGLIYRANDGFAGADTITIRISDQGNTGVDGPQSAGRELPVRVRPPNQAPLVALPGGDPTFTENGPAVTVAPGAIISDPDNSTFALSRIEFGFERGGNEHDRLGIPDQGTAAGQIGVLPGTPARLLFGGTEIGSFSGGTFTAPLLVSFNQQATQAQVQQVLANIEYHTKSDDPGAEVRSVRVRVTDGEGATSIEQYKNIKVVPVNDPPVLERHTGLSVPWNGSVALLPETLRASDLDTPPEHLTYTLVDLPRFGQLLRDGAVLSERGTFTQDDLDDGRVRYASFARSAISDRFTFTVSDGAGGVTAVAGYPIAIIGEAQSFRAYLPLVVRTVARSGPDLVGSLSLSPDRRHFSAGEPVRIAATITNQGDRPSGPFFVDFYINPSQPPSAANQHWETLCAMQPCFGISWYVSSGLAAGASITLNSDSVPAQFSRWPGWFASGTTDLYLYVDSSNCPTATACVAGGMVQEAAENNNRAALYGLSVTGANPAWSTTTPLRNRHSISR